MKRKFPALLLACALVLSLCACGGGAAPSDESPGAQAPQSPAPDAPVKSSVKVGLICAGGENDQDATYNFIRGKNDASIMLAADGIGAEWVVKWNVEEDAAENANRELAEEGCQLIFNAAPGFEASMRNAAPEYPDIQFVACGGNASWNDDLPNTRNAFANIHEGRYLAGIVAGMKLQEMIQDGGLAPEEAVIGYVAATDCAETVSGYSAFFLGARSVCPGVTMKALFVGDSPDADAEPDAAATLADMGCKLISQHSGNPAVALAAQDAGILHAGYNNDMTRLAPGASLASTRIDWSVCFECAIRALLNGEELEQDWRHGMDMRAVELTPLNRDLIADGTDEKLDEAKAALADGSLQVFDASAFTVNGEAVAHAFALDTDGDSVADAEEAVFDGAFHESYFQSAPYFTLEIDGIQKLS